MGWCHWLCLTGIGAIYPAAATAQARSAPSSALPAARYPVRLERSVMMAMRDGVRLSTDLYFPEGAGDKLPVILMRTPYDKSPARQPGSLAMPAYFFAGHGFVVAVQDVRGKYESEGEYLFAGNDARDGFDATQWVATQPWSNGKVGTYGCSYLGEVQYQQATLRNPHLAALIPQSAGPLQYRAGGGIEGGAYDVTALVGWFRRFGEKFSYHPPADASRADRLQAADYFRSGPILPDIDYRPIWNSLPVIDMLKKAGAPPTDFETVMSKDVTDPWWNRTDFIRPTDRFDVPALHIDSWYDFMVGEVLTLFNQFRTTASSPEARDNQFAIISPATHCRSESLTEETVVGTRPLGDARLGYFSIYLKWFEHWLKGEDNGVTKMPPLQLYLMGKNEWRGETAWPPVGTEFTNYYLHSDGRANSRYGSGRLTPVVPANEPTDHFVYDPATPVPTSGGSVCRGCSGSAEAIDGAVNQSDVELRNDVLVYSTPPLAQGVEVTGPIEATLFVSSSARDTDFTMKLVDVYPDGTAYNIQEGILRARYRKGFDQKVWMTPGEVYPLRIDLHATSNYFGPGHRIRVEVSSSNFPRFDRNLNTGGNNYDETKWIVAENTIHHSAKYASRIVLPIHPR